MHKTILSPVCSLGFEILSQALSKRYKLTVFYYTKEYLHLKETGE
jgi:hypothetical protein